MTDGIAVLPGLPALCGKPVHVAADGGRLTADAGVLLLAEVERRLGIAERLAACVEDPRDSAAVRHSIVEMIRFRALLIAAGYADANDCDATNLAGSPRDLYEDLYCARGQAENLIKAHKLHLASDRTSCTRATANQFRLLVHTAAYWLMHTLRGLTPKRSFWRLAQFDTFRIGLIKVAARVVELATRIKVSLPSAFP